MAEQKPFSRANTNTIPDTFNITIRLNQRGLKIPPQKLQVNKLYTVGDLRQLYRDKMEVEDPGWTIKFRE